MDPAEGRPSWRGLGERPRGRAWPGELEAVSALARPAPGGRAQGRRGGSPVSPRLRSSSPRRFGLCSQPKYPPLPDPATSAGHPAREAGVTLRPGRIHPRALGSFSRGSFLMPSKWLLPLRFLKPSEGNHAWCAQEAKEVLDTTYQPPLQAGQ